MALDDPATYMDAAAPRMASLPAIEVRRWFFCVLNMNHIRATFLSGQTSERVMREETLANLFAGEVGRTYWEAARIDWLRNESKEDRRFVAIVEDEYRKALQRGQAVTTSCASSRRKKQDRNLDFRSGVVFGGAILIGAGAAHLARTIARRRSGQIYARN
jgi:hypothetical protein